MYAADYVSDTIAACAVILAAGIPSFFVWLNGRKTRGELVSRVGTPNGKGDVAQMNERQLDELAAIREAQTVSRDHLRIMDSKLDAHSELANRRFRLLHHHLNIPFEEET